MLEERRIQCLVLGQTPGSTSKRSSILRARSAPIMGRLLFVLAARRGRLSTHDHCCLQPCRKRLGREYEEVGRVVVQSNVIELGSLCTRRSNVVKPFTATNSKSHAGYESALLDKWDRTSVQRHCIIYVKRNSHLYSGAVPAFASPHIKHSPLLCVSNDHPLSISRCPCHGILATHLNLM